MRTTREFAHEATLRAESMGLVGYSPHFPAARARFTDWLEQLLLERREEIDEERELGGAGFELELRHAPVQMERARQDAKWGINAPSLETIESPLAAALRELQARVATRARSIADLERNAAFWLGVRAGTNPAWSALRCSFAVSAVDLNRVSEAPYLAALGFLVDVYGVHLAGGSSLSAALDKLVLRTAHTTERSGYADHPLIIAGLVLLARHVAGEPHTETLRSAIDRTAHLGPAEVLVVAAATSAGIDSITTSSSTEFDLACLVLAKRILGDRADSLLARTSPEDPEEQLSKLALSRPLEAIGDFGTMIVVAALEATTSGPRKAGGTLSLRERSVSAGAVEGIVEELVQVAAVAEKMAAIIRARRDAERSR